MKVELKEKGPGEEVKPAETEELPATEPETVVGDVPEVAPEPSAEERVQSLEREKAELRGKAEAFREMAIKNESKQPDTKDQWKQVVMADMNGLSNEDFQAKYRMEKYQATASMLEQDYNAKTAKNDEKLARLEASSRLSAKYGKEFYAVQSEIDEIVEMASPEVRKDSAKLEKLIERAFLGSKRAEIVPVKVVTKPNGGDVRRVTPAFEKPSSRSAEKQNESDEIPEEHRAVSKAFGLTSEKERKELMSTDFITMDLGNGLIFRDPKKGVEKVA